MRQMNDAITRWGRHHRHGVLVCLLGAVLLSGSFSADAQVVVDDNGKVGIGTTSPARKLHIYESNSSAGGAFIVLNHVNNGASDTDGLELSANSDGSVNLWGRENGAMHIATNNTERVTISASGSVGIGTTNPTSGSGSVALHIKGANPDLRLERSSSGRVWEIENNEYLYIYDRTAGLNRFSISTNGNVGIGTTNPASLLDVTGGCINGSMCSDARLKEDIQPLPKQDSYLEKVLRLRGVSFQWKDRPQMGRQMGLIAQEVETVLPEAVTAPEGETAQKGLSCTALDAALIEAIKEQQAQIKAQQAELQALRQDLAAFQRTQSLPLVSIPHTEYGD